MEDLSELHNYLLLTPKSFRKLRSIPDTTGKTVETPQEEAIFVEDIFVTTPSIRSGGGLREAKYQDSQPMGSGVGGRDRRSNMAESGSLTAMGPTSSQGGVESKFGAASRQAGQYRPGGSIGVTPEAKSLSSEQATSRRTGTETRVWMLH